jgi:hypothetical protein
MAEPIAQEPLDDARGPSIDRTFPESPDSSVA